MKLNTWFEIFLNFKTFRNFLTLISLMYKVLIWDFIIKLKINIKIYHYEVVEKRKSFSTILCSVPKGYHKTQFTILDNKGLHLIDLPK